MRISKKILACVLAALMAICMMPISALADITYTLDSEPAANEAWIYNDDPFEGVEAYFADDYVWTDTLFVLQEDIELSEPLVIPEGSDIQIDLNGFSIIGNVADKMIKNYGTVEIVSFNEPGGHIYNTNTAGQGRDAFINYGTLTVNADVYFGDADEDTTNDNATTRGAGLRNFGTAIINTGHFTNINNAKGVYAYAFINDGNGTLTINDATVYGHNHGNVCNNDGTINIYGGNFSLVKTYSNSDYNLYVCETSVTNVYGGTFSCIGNTAAVCVDASDYVSAAINISGGSFTWSGSGTVFKKASATDDKVNISGGTFSAPLKAAWMANGYVYDAENDAIVGAVKNGENNYTSLKAALAAAQDGDIIELLADLEGEGIVVAENKFATGVTVDFGGHTYTVASTVGSTGTVTNGFQLNEGNNITFENGTVTSTVCKILIQNYSNLTIDNMTLTNANSSNGQYTLSNNFGDVVITNSIINASDMEGSYAYDICTGWSAKYVDGVSVTMNGSTTINGNIEVGSYANYPGTATIALNLVSGTINGKIVASSYNTSWKKVSDALGSNIVVTKSEDCKYAPPVGYVWENNVLVESNAADTMSITANDNVDLNLYIDATETATAQFKITYSDPTSDDEDAIVTKTQDATGASTDTVKVELAPAQINDTIKVEVLDDNGDVQRVIETSVADYCNTIIATVAEDPSAFGAKSAELAELAKSTLDYGKATAEYFGYNEDKFDAGNKLDAPNLDAITYEGNNSNQTGLTITNVSYVATTVPELRFYVTGYASEYDLERMNANLSVNFEGATAKFVKVDNKNVALSVKGVDITKFGTQLVIYNNGSPILYFVPITWAKAAAAQTTDEELQALGNAICNYYLMSVAYFG